MVKGSSCRLTTVSEFHVPKNGSSCAHSVAAAKTNSSARRTTHLRVLLDGPSPARLAIKPIRVETPVGEMLSYLPAAVFQGSLSIPTQGR